MTSLMERSASFGTLLLQVVVMAISGYLAFRGTITIGTFASFQALFVSLSYSFMYLAQYTPNLINAERRPCPHRRTAAGEAACCGRRERASNLRPCGTRSNSGRAVQLSRGDGAIWTVSACAFRAVHGRVRRTQRFGQEHRADLLLRFYDPGGGGVLFDGTDMRSAKQASLREQTAVVFQEGFLFNTTVRENIALGRTRRDRQEIVAAAKAAEIHDFIASLPQGYDTLAANGAADFRADSGSASPSRARCCAIPRSCCSTKRLPRSTRRRSTRSIPRSSELRAAAP